LEVSELLKKVRRIEIKAKGLINEMFSGDYHSAFKGRGMSFSEVREYQFGDDVRNIDWNVTARFDNPYVKVYEEERELTVMLVIDISGSSHTGGKGQLKREVMAELAAIISFSATQNNDKVGAILFAGDVELFIPPRKGKSHAMRIIRDIIEFEPVNKTTSIGGALRFLNNAIKRKSTVFLTNLGMIPVKDPETGMIHWLDTSSRSVRKNYEKQTIQWEGELIQFFKKIGLDNTVIHTEGSYIKSLRNLFKQREMKR
jgi:uncharacterized protein (DUF58 family)